MPSPARLLPLALLAFGLPLASCTHNSSPDYSSGATGTGQYASYPSDGHYNPYPPGSTAKPSKYQYQQYSDSGSGGEPPPSSSSSTKKKKKKTTHVASSDSSSKSKSSSSHKSSGSYIVKSKDTLWSIAHKHHTTVSKLKSLNGLSSDVVHDGQKLKLP